MTKPVKKKTVKKRKSIISDELKAYSESGFPLIDINPIYDLTGAEFREALENRLRRGEHPLLIVYED